MREISLPLISRMWDTYLAEGPTHGFGVFHVVCEGEEGETEREGEKSAEEGEGRRREEKRSREKLTVFSSTYVQPF
jgi:hypothetical protein